MKKLLTLAAAVLVTFALPAFAKTYKMPKEEPIASIAFPNDWKMEGEDDSITGTSPDDGVQISVEVNDAESIAGAIEETLGYLKKNKVVIDKSTQKQKESKTSFGADVVDISWEGKDEDGPTNIGLTIIQMTEKKGLLVMFWGSNEAMAKNMDAIQSITKSLKKP